MNVQDGEALVDAVEAAFANQGIELYSGAARLNRWLDERYPLLEASLSRETLLTYLQSGDAADDACNGKMLSLVQAAPAIVQQFVQQSIVGVASTIPAAAGRPVALTPERKREIVEAVGQLNMQGVQMGLCQQRAAQRFGIGKRTVQRVWRHRAELEASPFQTIHDLLNFFKQ